MGGVVGALVTAVAAALLNGIDTRQPQQKETRIEALAEHKDVRPKDGDFSTFGQLALPTCSPSLPALPP